MGGCFSESLGPEEQDAKLRSNEIDKQLKKDKSIMERTIKLLLLGECYWGSDCIVEYGTVVLLRMGCVLCRVSVVGGVK